MQEIGRGGCDGRVAVALLNYPTGDHHLFPAMRKYVKKIQHTVDVSFFLHLVLAFLM